MSRIEIDDLPIDETLDKSEMQKVRGGTKAPIGTDPNRDAKLASMAEQQAKTGAGAQQIEMVSNISKQKHKTAKNAIQSIGR